MRSKRGHWAVYTLLILAILFVVAATVLVIYNDSAFSSTGRVSQDTPSPDSEETTNETISNSPPENPNRNDNETIQDQENRSSGGGGGGGGGGNGGDDGGGQVFACNDGLDNDADGFCDTFLGSCSDGSIPGDPMCIFPTDTTELAVCQDGIDNDADGFIDLTDPGCSNSNDNDEYTTQLSDGCENQDLLDDRYYLYSNTSEINVTIFTKPDGNESFTVTTLGGTVLRNYDPSDDAFYAVPGGQKKPEVEYDIVQVCGGVDIIYTITNTNNIPSNIPGSFRIAGLAQDFSQQAKLLYANDYGNMISMYNNDGSLNNSYLGLSKQIDQIKYPGVYSPAIVTQGTTFSAGSALEYPYLIYQHSVVMNLDRSVDGTWVYKYDAFIDEKTKNGTKLSPNEQRVYTVSLRFGRPDGDYWIFTMSPYKEYFNSLYSPYKDIPPRDLTPIRSIQLADHVSSSCKSDGILLGRFYCDVGKNGHTIVDLLQTGWGPFVDEFVSNAIDRGFKRTMIWTPSGVYDHPSFNFPPQFMDFLPILQQTDGFFSLFAEQDLELGFWWGRSLSIPYNSDGSILTEEEWLATTLISADLLNESHVAYLERELDLALGRGANIIGLDAFTGGYQKYYWLDYMKQYAQDHYGREIYFVGEASQADLIHSKAGNYYSPCKHVFWDGPDLLSYYLNPEAEIWLQFGANFKDENGNEIFICPEDYQSGTLEEIQKHIKWGYTRMLKNFQVTDDFPTMGLNITDFEEYECLNHEDDDGDGKVDWPLDPDCNSFEDDSE